MADSPVIKLLRERATCHITPSPVQDYDSSMATLQELLVMGDREVGLKCLSNSAAATTSMPVPAVSCISFSVPVIYCASLLLCIVQAI